MLCFIEGGSISDDIMAIDTLESSIQLDRAAYIAGDLISGVVNVRANKSVELMCMHIKLVGEGMALYFKANYRTKRFCEIKAPPISAKEHCIEPLTAWKIPFTLRLDSDLYSSIDSGKKGRVCYFLSWELKVNVGESTRNAQEITILADQDLASFPTSREITGNNEEEEEYDNMKLQLYSPANAYLPGEQIQFRAYAQNFNKTPVKKIAVLLIQNVLFRKSSSDEVVKGRIKSFLMSASEKSVQLKQDEEMDWTDEIQIPDPIAPSARGFHFTNYELVLVAITKGKKSDIRAVFDQARIHFDLERYQDDYFRDFLPHAHCDLIIGSRHGNKRSTYMSTNQQQVLSKNDDWKLKTQSKSERKHMPRTKSQGKLSRITINPPQ